METSNLIEKIVQKGGLMASCAKQYMNNKELSEKFLIECSEQCHTDFAKEYWGNQLVQEIMSYASRKTDFHHKKLTEILKYHKLS